MKNDEPKSMVPSRMKRMQDIYIIEEQPLKARVRTVVFTNQNESSDHVIEVHKEIVSTNHVTAEEVSNPDEEIETDEAPKTLEDGGQATVDELKELNLGTLEDPRPMYISALITQEEEQELLDKFDIVKLSHVPRSANKMANTFASLAATLALGAEETMYGIPQRIITDNGKPFVNNLMDIIFQKFKFTQHKSSMYNAPANDLAEAFNKTLCNLLSKVVAKSKRDWHEKIGEAIWAYRTTYKNATQSTPYSSVYGVEVVLPLEVQIPSLRIAIQEDLTSDENDKLRLVELEALDENRLQAQQKLQCYQARMTHAFNKKVRPRSFQVGDMVLAVRRHINTLRKTGNKFTSKWDGPYMVREVYTNGAYKIVDAEGLRKVAAQAVATTTRQLPRQLQQPPGRCQAAAADARQLQELPRKLRQPWKHPEQLQQSGIKF
uniref:Integrase catalytic domain-containing protein n=1 Tax=Chenopodium quinoa TaxID=63459 RepID=A0A803L3S7_CHEQI